jgi:hypothetical protein
MGRGDGVGDRMNRRVAPHRCRMDRRVDGMAAGVSGHHAGVASSVNGGARAAVQPGVRGVVHSPMRRDVEAGVDLAGRPTAGVKGEIPRPTGRMTKPLPDVTTGHPAASAGSSSSLNRPPANMILTSQASGGVYLADQATGVSGQLRPRVAASHVTSDAAEAPHEASLDLRVDLTVELAIELKIELSSAASDLQANLRLSIAGDGHTSPATASHPVSWPAIAGACAALAADVPGSTALAASAPLSRPDGQQLRQVELQGQQVAPQRSPANGNHASAVQLEVACGGELSRRSSLGVAERDTAAELAGDLVHAAGKATGVMAAHQIVDDSARRPLQPGRHDPTLCSCLLNVIYDVTEGLGQPSRRLSLSLDGHALPVSLSTTQHLGSPRTLLLRPGSRGSGPQGE